MLDCKEFEQALLVKTHVKERVFCAFAGAIANAKAMKLNRKVVILFIWPLANVVAIIWAYDAGPASPAPADTDPEPPWKLSAKYPMPSDSRGKAWGGFFLLSTFHTLSHRLFLCIDGVAGSGAH